MPAPCTPPADARESAPRTAPRLALVLLTWNGKQDTLACLASLAPQLDPGDVVFVVDNGSSDGTQEEVSARFPWVSYVQNGANLGFAGGCNRGLALALSDGAPWILLLNTDTRVEPGALAALRTRAQSSAPHIGAWQALLLRESDPTCIDSAGHAVGWLPGVRELHAGAEATTLAREPFAIFGACAAAALLRRQALLAAGLLDEAFFVLLEDVDLMFRIRAAGFTVMLAPDARVRHRRGVSGRGSPVASRQRKFWLQRNAVTLALRYWPTRALCLSAPVLGWRALQAIACGRRSGLRSCLRLWGDAFRARLTWRARLRSRGVDRWFGAAWRQDRVEPTS
jgi:GT2 family glycosyltransferase